MPSALALRMAGFYGAYFTVAGIYLPFWPVWLAHREMNPTEIGVLLAVGSIVKIVANLFFARIADRTGRTKLVVIGLGLASVLTLAAFGLVNGFAAFLILSLLVGAVFSPMMPLGESITIRQARAGRIDYGRVRLWGSITFMIITVIAGWLIGLYGAGVIHALVVAAAIATFLTTLSLPADAGRMAAPRKGAALALARHPAFLLFLLAASMAQASHAVYYGFSALHWRASGLSETVIGLLWAEGVIAEILLFAVGAKVTARIGPAALLALAGAAGMLRWGVSAETTELWVLAIVQVLHAVTFGAAHLAAMAFLTRAVPDALSATAQSLYAGMVSGVAFGMAMPLSGWLYGQTGGGAFYLPVVLSLLALLAALSLHRRWDGGVLLKDTA
ncbi:MAG: 3-phenylpropionate MFS transporter [Oceanibaculum nanhaiense]|uniref:3-phenylpropionate MFS transporter n=1 Tax=Oceanibaculum nanhaiense TaxID=1909734 RepID=UPI0025A4B317|nr:3-phenylpropionate MFS transporter [Oceanibaculum nanhaiense]MDM7945369.1 3-phenylpropionate MFS transporter [Oceanibaculum nanhaiense]